MFLKVISTNITSLLRISGPTTKYYPFGELRTKPLVYIIDICCIYFIALSSDRMSKNWKLWKTLAAFVGTGTNIFCFGHCVAKYGADVTFVSKLVSPH